MAWAVGLSLRRRAAADERGPLAPDRETSTPRVLSSVDDQWPNGAKDSLMSGSNSLQRHN
jgi:hypothetical protein